jgi:hypothetical protein
MLEESLKTFLRKEMPFYMKRMPSKFAYKCPWLYFPVFNFITNRVVYISEVAEGVHVLFLKRKPYRARDRRLRRFVGVIGGV